MAKSGRKRKSAKGLGGAKLLILAVVIAAILLLAAILGAMVLVRER